MKSIRAPHLAAAAIIVMAMPAAALSQSTPDSVRARRAFGYFDTVLARVVMIGGPDRLGARARDSVWSWSGRDWELVTADGPEARGNPGAGYDPKRQMAIYTGGVRRMANDSAYEIIGETWVQRSGTWQRAPSMDTDERDHHMIVYDEQRDALILVGGIMGDRSAPWPRNTLALRDDGWTEVTRDGPSARGRFGMVYDSKRKHIVLFGGAGEAPARGQPQPFYGDTWIFDANGWRKAADTGPRGRYAHGMVYDEKANVVWLYSGAAAHRDAPLADMWKWDGERWTEVQLTGPTPGHRYSPVMVYDRARGKTVLYGGSGAPNDTWEWDGRTWTRVIPRAR